MLVCHLHFNCFVFVYTLPLNSEFSLARLDLDVNAKKEPMKDYAVQQKKLYEDVTNYCQRNRDAAVQREDQQLRELMAKKLEEREKEEEEERQEPLVENEGKEKCHP